MHEKKLTRCPWSVGNKLIEDYHDHEWGKPQHNDQKLFEMICLEGAQAGLSWLTVLKKRQAYRLAFDNFNILKIANYPTDKINQLLADKTIISNRLKILSVINNAQVVLKIQQNYGSLDNYLWSYVQFKTIKNQQLLQTQLPSTNSLSITMAHDLKKIGFIFFGPKICYAFMQATGIINDHVINCFYY